MPCISIICSARTLENTWGAFRFNLYFFAGMLFHVIAAFAAYFITGVSFPLGTWYLNMSLFLAFAAIYPDMEFYLFFMIPVKAKWLGWLDGLYFLYTIAQAFLPAYGGSVFGFVYKSNAIAAGCLDPELCDLFPRVQEYAAVCPEAAEEKAAVPEEDAPGAALCRRRQAPLRGLRTDRAGRSDA